MTKTKTKPFFREKITKVLIVDHKNVPTGTYFKATIDKKSCTGLIYNDKSNKSLFFCQNKVTGTKSPNLLGYNYSWKIDYNESFRNQKIFDLEFPSLPKGFKLPLILPMIANYSPKILKGYLEVGCTQISNKVIREIVKHLKD